MSEVLAELEAIGMESCVSCDSLRETGHTGLRMRLKPQNMEPLADRQRLPSAAHLKRSSERLRLTPKDDELFFTPWNWANVDGVAVTNAPGAYMKLAWVGGASDGDVLISIDSSGWARPFMTLAASVDGNACHYLTVPAGDANAVVCVPMQPPPSRVQSLADLTLLEAASEQMGSLMRSNSYAQLPLSSSWHCLSSSDTDDDDPHRVHTLTVHVHNMLQHADRWGTASADGGQTSALPAVSLRVRHVELPVNATSAVRPLLHDHRLLAFGCSITEGTGANYRATGGIAGSGTLRADMASATWVTKLASCLGCEYSSVGYGRLGWTISGNGNVPHFVGVPDASKQQVDGEGSWNWLWAGKRRTFEELPDLVVVNLGTNDGAYADKAGSPADVIIAIVAWLEAARRHLGPNVDICLLVPFGGFGGEHRPPHNVFVQAYEDYQAAFMPAEDDRTHLIDLGEPAAKNLTGYKFDNETGKFASSRESADGLHPSVARHAELGQMVYEALAPRLPPSLCGAFP